MSRILSAFILFTFSVFGTAPAFGARLNVVTLNLHGYHPMGMEERVLESRDGKKRRADSYLTYFRYEDIRAGHERQLEYLANRLLSLRDADKPNIILLQEVGAGLPNSKKDCGEFYFNAPGDAFGKTSAFRLQSRLAALGDDYQVELGCRGNIGWQTDASTFSKERVLTKSGQIVFDFNSNPYANGFIVEGTAILVRAPYRSLEQRVDWLPIEGTTENVFLEFARIQKTGDRAWYLVANLHGTHKVRHFEFALAARERLQRFIDTHPDRRNFAGVIVGGDFNATLYRPSKGLLEVSTVPWEIAVPGEFDFETAANTDFAKLEADLWQQNIDSKFKPWASIGSDTSARARVQSDVDRFRRLAQSPHVALRETFDQVGASNCLNFPLLVSACARRDRIDLIYASPTLKPVGAAVIFSQNDFVSLDGPTDHPGIYVRYETQN